MSEKRRRQCQILVRLSQEEITIIEKKAAQAELTPASFLREVGLQKTVSAPNFSQKEREYIIRQLAGIGNNLNQLTKLAHERKVKPDDLLVKLDEFKEVAKKLWQLLCVVVQSGRGR